MRRLHTCLIMMIVVFGMAVSGCGATPSTGALEGNTAAMPGGPTAMPAPTDAHPTAAPQPTGAPASAMTVKTGEPFRLTVGQSAQLASGQITMTFVEVAEDSRCPRGVECVWAGQVVVVLDVSENGQSSGPVKLTLSAARPAAMATAQVGGHTVQLMDVAPYPQNGKQIAPADYTATLQVR